MTDERGQVDLACVHDPLPQRGFVVTPLVREEVLLVGRREMMPKGLRVVRIGDLRGLPLVLPSRTNASRRLLDAWAARKGISLDVRVEVDDHLVMRALVRQGIGFTLLTRGSVEAERRNGPIEGLPFDQRSGVIPNESGRVLDPATKKPIPGVYVSGWIKRGPSGVIGTNKKDGTETATAMLEDAVASGAVALGIADPEVVDALVRGRCPECVTYSDWARLDAIEVKLGEAKGRPRVKLTTRQSVKDALNGR